MNYELKSFSSADNSSKYGFEEQATISTYLQKLGLPHQRFEIRQAMRNFVSCL
jgi:hypothetical protein